MAPGHETPRGGQGGPRRAGSRSPRPSGEVCAESPRLEGSPETGGVPPSGAGPDQNGTCSGGGIGGEVCTESPRLEGSPETGGVPPSGAGPDQNGTCSGGGIGRKFRPGRSTIRFRLGRTQVCGTPIGLHRDKKLGFSRFVGRRTAAGNRISSHITRLLSDIFAFRFSRAYNVVVTDIRGSTAGPFSPSPLRDMVGGIARKSKKRFRFILEEFEWYIAGEKEKDLSAAST